VPERYLRPDPEVKTASTGASPDKNDLSSESGEKEDMDSASDDSEAEAESSEKGEEKEKEKEEGKEEGKEEEKEKKHGPSFYSLATDWLK
jgi:hypothetical protein